jgi:hypothetical protein
MSIAPHKIPAAPCVSLGVRSSVCSMIVCGVLLGGAMSEAVAGPGGPGGGGPGGGGPGGGGNFGGGNFNGAQSESFNQAAPRRDEAARSAAQPMQRDGQQRDVQREAQRYDARAPKGGEVRQIDPRSFEGRAEEQRRALDQNREGYRKTHLTPDERRDLRRQINEAGPEIYTTSPHH